MNLPVMQENRLSLFGKALVVICMTVLAVVAAANIWRGAAPHPGLFVIAIAGLLLFVVAKLSVIVRIRRVSFGTALMSPAMANAYRAGYWLMLVGVVATFL